MFARGEDLLAGSDHFFFFFFTGGVKALSEIYTIKKKKKSIKSKIPVPNQWFSVLLHPYYKRDFLFLDRFPCHNSSKTKGWVDKTLISSHTTFQMTYRRELRALFSVFQWLYHKMAVG